MTHPAIRENESVLRSEISDNLLDLVSKLLRCGIEEVRFGRESIPAKLEYVQRNMETYLCEEWRCFVVELEVPGFLRPVEYVRCVRGSKLEGTFELVVFVKEPLRG